MRTDRLLPYAPTALAAAAMFLAATLLARHGLTAADLLRAAEWSRPYTF